MGERMKIILASASPRRRELLMQLGLDFKVKVTDAEEIVIVGETPAEQVKRISLAKAEVLNINADELIIAADTVVVAPSGQILGKPKDEADALKMLMLLTGKTHSVFTGVTIRTIEKTHSFACESKVTFDSFNEVTAKAYIATGEPMDKAGAYGIQGKGGALVERIEGDYFNIVGLPVCALRQALCQFNLSVL